MKAAVLHHFGSIPRYEEFPDPTPGKEEILVQVKAVALEHVDKAMAKGTHYASRQLLPTLPAIVGTDGIAMRDDGQLVGFGGLRSPYGAMAEKAVFPKAYHVPIPDGVDAASAATVPASALTSLFPLKWGAKLQPGETVLINGATGFTGKLAVQVARLLGAKRVIGTGRNPIALEELHDLGADAVIDLKQSDENIVAAFKQEAKASETRSSLIFCGDTQRNCSLKRSFRVNSHFPNTAFVWCRLGKWQGQRFTLLQRQFALLGLRFWELGAVSLLRPSLKGLIRCGNGSKWASSRLILSKCHSKMWKTPGSALMFMANALSLSPEDWNTYNVTLFPPAGIVNLKNPP